MIDLPPPACSRRWLTALTLLASAALAAGCGGPLDGDDSGPSESASRRDEPIANADFEGNPHGVVRLVTPTQTCSGVLLDDWAVLTAKSCVSDKPAQVDVTLKTLDGEVTRSSSSYSLHEKLDVAVLHLSTAIPGFNNVIYRERDKFLETAYMTIWGYGGTLEPGFVGVHMEGIDGGYLITEELLGLTPVEGDRGGPCIGPTSLEGVPTFVTGVLSGCANDPSAPFWFDPNDKVTCGCVPLEKARDWIHGVMHIGAVLYENPGYKGASQPLHPLGGGHRDYRSNQLAFDDKTSSIHVPHGWQLAVYSSDDFGGLVDGFIADVPSLGVMNDAISSAKLSADVVVYNNHDLTGATALLSPGNHVVSFAAFGFFPDGIRVPADWRVTLVYTNSLLDPPVATRVLQGGRFRMRQQEDGRALTMIQIEEPAIVYADQDHRGALSLLLPGGPYATGALMVGDDKVSSLYVPADREVVLFKDHNLAGPSWTFSDTTNYVGGLANDKATLITVE